MKREFFNDQFAAMLAVYSSAKVPEVAQDIYWEMLWRLPEDRFALAVRQCLARCKFFPTIAELIEAEKGLPRPKLKLLEAPRPSDEEIEHGRKMLENFTRSLANKTNVR